MTVSNPIEASREFLRKYVAEADFDELANVIEAGVRVNAGPFLQALKSVEHLLAHPPPGDTLLQLVTVDAGIRLGDPSGESARRWLEWLARQIRREVEENLLPFQPMRAQLLRSAPPDDERFPHDLRLYPTDDPWPECWNPVWGKNVFYSAFKKEWDGRTCPSCRAPTVQCTAERRDGSETDRSRAYPERVAVYRCTRCRCGWTERTEGSGAPGRAQPQAPLLLFAQGGSVLLRSASGTVIGLDFATLAPRYVCAGRLIGVSGSGRILATEKEPGVFGFWDSASGQERALGQADIADLPFEVRYRVSLRQTAGGRYEGCWTDITGQDSPVLFSIGSTGTTRGEQIDNWTVVSARRWLALAWSWQDADFDGSFGSYYSPSGDTPPRVSLKVSRFHSVPPMYFSRQHDWLVTGEQTGFNVYVASTGQPIGTGGGTFDLLDGGGDLVAFHPQQRSWLAVNRRPYLSKDRERQGFVLLDIAVPTSEARRLRSFQETRPVAYLAFHPSGEWIAALLDEGTIHIWETATGHRRPDAAAE